MNDILLWLAGLLYVGTCLWLILVVLMQEGKTGGMAGMETPGAAPGALMDSFGAGGAQKTLFNATIYAAGLFFFLAIMLTLLGGRKEVTGGNLDLDSETPAAATTTSVPVTSTPSGTPGESDAVVTDTKVPPAAEPVAATPAPAEAPAATPAP
ncbi:hypothetical protein BH09SUM1_BH09SUM1_04520 [soil metagenome]